MSDIVFNSVSEAILGLQSIGIDASEVDIITDASGTVTIAIESKYIDNSVVSTQPMSTIPLVENTGEYSLRAGAIKVLKAGQNITLVDNGTYVEIMSTSGSVTVDSLGDIQSKLTSNFLFADLLGDMSSNNYNNINTIVQKISDLQTTTATLGSNKANQTDFQTLTMDLTNLTNSVLHTSTFTVLSDLIGDLSGFSSSSTVSQSLANKASVTSLNVVIGEVNDLSLGKADKTTLETLKMNIGTLAAPLVGQSFTASRTLIDTLGDMSIYDNTNTLISLLGDLTFIKNSGTHTSLLNYIHSIETNASDYNTNYKNNVIGNLININDLDIGYTLSDLIGNPSLTYLSSGSLNSDKIINFASSFNTVGPDNKITIINLLTKIGKLYDNLLDTNTLVDVIGDFKNNSNINSVLNRTEYVSISQSLKFVHETIDIHGTFNKLSPNRKLANILGDFTINDKYNVNVTNNTVVSKINNIETYIEKKLGLITNINDNKTDVIDSSRMHLYDIIGNVNNYAYDINTTPFNKDKYYPLFAKNDTNNLFQAYTECINYINEKKALITNIIANINNLTQDELTYLNDINSNLNVGLVYNENHSLTEEINKTVTDIYVEIIELFAVKYYVFKDINDVLIVNQGEPLKLINGITYKFNQKHSSNILYPIGFSLRENGNSNLNDTTFNFDTVGSGLNVDGLIIVSTTTVNPDLILYDGISYIIESNGLLTKNLLENYKLNKIKVYTDVNLINEYIDNQYNNGFTLTSIQFNVSNNITDNTILYYGINVFNRLFVGKIILRTRHYTTGVTYTINGLTYTPSEYALNIGTNVDRYVLINAVNYVTLYYFYIENNGHDIAVGFDDYNTDNNVLQVVNRQSDTSLEDNLTEGVIEVFTGRNIVINNWNDNLNYLFFIPYLSSLSTINNSTIYNSIEHKYTDASGLVHRFNLELHYKSKDFDIISDIVRIDSRLSNIYNEADSNLSNILTLGNMSSIYTNTNRTFVNIFGSNPIDVFTPTGTVISYLEKLGTQTDINAKIPGSRSLMSIMGNLNEYDSVDTITNRLNILGTSANIISNLPVNTKVIDILGDLSSWTTGNNDTIGRLLLSTGKLTLGGTLLTDVYGDLSTWNSSTNDSIATTLNKLGILNVNTNKLTNIFGDLTTWNTLNNHTLSEMFIKLGKMTVTNTNTLSLVIGNMTNWLSVNNDDLMTLLNKINKINVGTNKLTNVLGNLDENTWSTTTQDTLSELLTKTGKMTIGTNKLSNVLGNLNETIWNTTNQDTLSALFIKTGKITVGTNKLSEVFGILDQNTWRVTNQDTLSELFTKTGKIIIGTNVLSSILGNIDQNTWTTFNQDTLSSLFIKLGKITLGTNVLSNILGDLDENKWGVSNQDTLSELFIKTGKMTLGTNILSNVLGDLNTWDSTNQYTLSELFTKLGKMTIGTNLLSNVIGDVSTWNNTNRDTIGELLNKIGKLNIGTYPYDYTFNQIIGDLDYWNNVNNKYDTVADVIKFTGKLKLTTNVTFGDILGNFDVNNGGVTFLDTIANVITKVGLSTIIESYLPVSKNDLISLIGDMSSSFTNDTIADRLIDLGTHTDMSEKLPTNTSLINTLGNFFTNGSYDSTKTVTKRFEYLIGKDSNSVDLFYNSLPKIGLTTEVDRSLTLLLGDFNNVSYGYVSSTKTLVKSVYDIETVLGDLTSTNIINKLNTVETFRINTMAALGNLASKTPQTVGSQDLTDLAKLLGDMTGETESISTRITNTENAKLTNTIFGAFSIEGYYPVYFTEAEALAAQDATSTISFPTLSYGPYLKDPITQIPNHSIASWNVLPKSLATLQLYMPVSVSITQHIPTINDSYLHTQLGINELTTYPLPNEIESIRMSIKETNDVFGSNVLSFVGPSGLGLNNISNLLGDMSNVTNSVQSRLSTIETINTSIGALSSVLSTGIPTLAGMLGTSSTNSISINSRLNSIESVFGVSDGIITKQYSTTLTNLNLILGNMTNQTESVQDRLVLLENNSDNVFGMIDSILPSYPSLNTLSKLIGDMSSEIEPIQTRIKNIETGLIAGIIWKQSLNTLADLDALNEEIIQVGWAYYIKNMNDSYVVIDNLDGDYLPTGWLLKSFIKIADFTELSVLVITEQTRATAAENLNTTAIINEVTRATAAESTLTTNLNNEITRNTAAYGANLTLITDIQTVVNTIGTLQLPVNDTLAITLGDLSGETIDIQTRVDLLEKKIGIKNGSTADFSSDFGLKLPENKTLSDILGGGTSLSMMDFTRSDTEPVSPELANTPIHDDLMTIMRKLGRLSMGTPTEMSGIKYYNNTLSEIIGNLNGYDLDTLGSLITRLLTAEMTITTLNSQIATLNNPNIISTLNDNLDYYISLDNTGVIVNNGNLGSLITGESTDQTAVLYNSNRTHSTSTVIMSSIIEENGVTWLRNDNNINNTANQMVIANVNTSKYLSTGFTIICYMKNFLTGTIPNIVSIITPAKDRQGKNRITHIRLSSTDTNLIVTSEESNSSNMSGANIPATPIEPNYSYNNINNEFAFTDSNPITDNSNNVWFFAITFSGHLSNDYVNGNTNETIENKGGIQIFYKRDGFNYLNKTTKWIPNFNVSAEHETDGNLSKFFDNYSWFIFGGKSMDPKGNLDALGRNNFILDDYDNGNIEAGAGVQTSNCNVSEMSVFNKMLTNMEINELSNLTPVQFKNRFRV
jgi:hypothetical protein